MQIDVMIHNRYGFDAAYIVIGRKNCYRKSTHMRLSMTYDGGDVGIYATPRQAIDTLEASLEGL